MSSINTPELLFSKTFKGVVWKVLADVVSGHLFLEVRNPEVFQTTFAAVDYREGKLLWENRKVDEQWWVSMLASHENVLLLQFYTHGGNPDQKSILAMDVNKWKSLWRRDHFAFHDLSGDYILGYDIPSDWKALTLRLRSGEEVKQPSIVPLKNSGKSAVELPVLYPEGSEYFSTCASFITAELNHAPLWSVEYLESSDAIFISYYVKEDEKVANYLLMMSPKDGIRLHEKLDDNLTGPGLETFFILEGCLIFVKNKCHFFNYRIS